MRFMSPSRRRLRQARILSLRWQRRAVFVLGGGVVGVVAVLLAITADWAGNAFTTISVRAPLAPFALTPLGFAACCWLSRRYFPNSGGSGIPQVIAATHLHGLAPRQRLVSLRVAAGKIILLLMGLMCGASIGREGPTVQVGAAIMFAIGRLSPRRQPGLLLAGASAGRCSGLQHPARGYRFRHRGDEPLVRGAHQRHHPRRGDRGRHHVAVPAGRLHLFRNHECSAWRHGRGVARRADPRCAGRPARGRLQPHARRVRRRISGPGGAPSSGAIPCCWRQSAA